MAEHKTSTKTKDDQVDHKHHLAKQDSKPSSEQQDGWEHGLLPLTETPFYPRMDEHIAILSRVPFSVQRREFMMRLHQTYGNRYVQRLMESMAVQAKPTVSSPDDIYEKKGDQVAEKAVGAISSPQVQRQDEDELDYPGPRMAPLREKVAQERGSSERSFSPAQRASPSSSATGNIGDAIDLDGQALYGWNRAINAADVETVVNGVVPTMTSDEEMPRIVMFSGTHGNEAGHLVNDAISRGFVDEDQATANAANAADPQVQAEVIDVVNSYPTKADLTANYGRTNYIRILAWCFSKQSYDLGNGIKSNWWAAPDNL